MHLENVQPEFQIQFSGGVKIAFEIEPKYVDELQGMVDVDVNIHKEKRSLSANAYAWVLLDKLSKALGRPSEEIYREDVRSIGGVSEYVCIQNEAVGTMKRIWEQRGIGWQVEELDSKIAGCTNLKLTYGSSVFDSEQMARLIDVIVQDCIALGIETKTPDEIAELIAEWQDNEKHITR